MASTAQQNALIIATYNSFFVSNCCGFAGLALLTYEYALLFGREVDLFWKKKKTGATALFLLNRYFTLATEILEACGLVHMSDTRSVLSGRAPVHPSSHRPSTAAPTSFPQCESSRLHITILSRACLITADLIVLLVTWNATYRTSRMHRTILVNTSSFASTLLRDGSIYFGILLLLNALHLILSLLSINLAFSSISYVTLFTEPITAVLVSRLLANLQEVNQDMVSQSHTTDARLGTSSLGGVTINFARVVGSLGSSLTRTDGGEEDEDGESDDFRPDDAKKVAQLSEGGGPEGDRQDGVPVPVPVLGCGKDGGETIMMTPIGA
ncbi:hypothetical protein BD413DRAFT_617040 [Trametes elegans]|nr:hypothetical protein BD413DRAFT_617040 [Trametes elegans]